MSAAAGLVIGLVTLCITAMVAVPIVYDLYVWDRTAKLCISGGGSWERRPVFDGTPRVSDWSCQLPERQP